MLGFCFFLFSNRAVSRVYIFFHCTATGRDLHDYRQYRRVPPARGGSEYPETGAILPVPGGLSTEYGTVYNTQIYALQHTGHRVHGYIQYFIHRAVHCTATGLFTVYPYSLTRGDPRHRTPWTHRTRYGTNTYSRVNLVLNPAQSTKPQIRVFDVRALRSGRPRRRPCTQPTSQARPRGGRTMWRRSPASLRASRACSP